MTFFDLAKERYSVRAYQDRPVEQVKIDRILQAARVAPTACNYQPQKIWVATSEQARDALAKITPCTFGAPVVFIIGYDTERDAHGMLYPEYEFGTVDCTIACTHMILQATELGLGSCWVGRFCEKDVKDAFGLPDNIRIRHLLPVGYAQENAVPSPRHTEYRPADEIIEYI